MDVIQAFALHGSCHLISIDFRGHGCSEGSTFSFGKRETMDIEAVLDYLSASSEFKDLPVGCYGISMGGAIGIIAAAHFPKIKAVVSDSAYGDFGKAVARALRMAYHIPRFPLGQIVVWFAQLRLGCSAKSISPKCLVGRVSPRPVLIIHGTADKTVPWEDGQSIYDAAKDPKRLWLVPESEHVACFYRDRMSYTRTVLGFFENEFRRTP